MSKACQIMLPYHPLQDGRMAVKTMNDYVNYKHPVYSHPS